MPTVRVRVTVGVGAWIAGAAAATGLSLFAVSYLNTDPQSPQGATLSQDQVDQALASMTGTSGAATAPGAPAGTVTTGTTPSAAASPSQPEPSATTSAAPSRAAAVPQPVERLLSGDAGSVVAQCQASLAYLLTWSPAQGYQAEVLQRGPAHPAVVVFTGYGNRVEFRVGCPAGVPALVEGDDGRVDR